MKFTKSLALVHGYLCADGYVCSNLPHQKHKYYSIGLRNTCDVLLKDFQVNFYEVFQVKPKLISGQRCRIYSKNLYQKLMEYGPYHSYTWQFPKLSKKNSSYWLRAFFDCEGTVTVIGRQSRSIAAESVNRNQLIHLQKALSGFSIRARIYHRKNRNTSVLYIQDKQSIINFQKYINFIHPKKQQQLKKAIGSFVDYRWSQVLINSKEFIRQKCKFKKPYYIRIFSIIEGNLINLSDVLRVRYNIESRFYKGKNGIGTKYYYLSIQKQGEVKKLIEHKLLNKGIIQILNKTFIKE